MKILLCSYRILALRKAEKEEERRAREKIRQKLEEDKVCISSATLSNVSISSLIMTFSKAFFFLFFDKMLAKYMGCIH